MTVVQRVRVPITHFTFKDWPWLFGHAVVMLVIFSCITDIKMVGKGCYRYCHYNILCCVLLSSRFSSPTPEATGWKLWDFCLQVLWTGKNHGASEQCHMLCRLQHQYSNLQINYTAVEFNMLLAAKEVAWLNTEC